MSHPIGFEFQYDHQVCKRQKYLYGYLGHGLTDLPPLLNLKASLKDILFFFKRRQTSLLIIRTQCTREIYNKLNKEIQTSERRRIIGIRRCTRTSQLG